MIYLIYNPKAANNHGEEIKDKAVLDLKDEIEAFEIVNGLEINLDEFHQNLKPEDKLIIIGGDGTIHMFANVIKKYNITNELFLYRGGSGNDFLRDIEAEGKLIQLNKYFEHLPVVEVNGEKRYFINNVCFGMDGEVCVVANKQRAKHKKKVSYTTIAAKLVLLDFKRPNARVIVDGEETSYKKVWTASALNGRYVGAGMKLAPEQDRFSGYFTNITIWGQTRLRTALAFPTIFKGNHVKKSFMVKTKKCKRIEVFFDKPCGLQVDGEVFTNVTSYVAYYED